MPWSSGSVRRAARALILCVVAALPAAADTAFVTCQNGDGLSVLDLTGGQERARWSVPGKPAGVAVSRDGAVFTVAPDSKTVRRHDRSGTVLAEVALDGGPIGIAHDARRGRVFVSDWYNARIWVLSDDTLTLDQELMTGAAPAGLALSEDGRFLASADRDADQVSVFDADTLALLHRVTVGIRPFGLRFAPDGRLFVGNVGSNDVSVVDAAAGSVTATVPVGERPYGVAFAAGRAFVTNQYENTVSVIDMGALTEVTRIEVGEYPEGIDVTADGSRIVVANWFDNTASVIDAKALTVLKDLDTCDGPRAFGVFLLGGEE
ncbi:YncE family protein [Antarctobacter sp.]|uniref:YncE family protein n=1 Tax=Antarctobacter sp. TaxID=1872577 RepID=UPI002B272329|nr:YncE family protein [Antarctobacter sp.]